MDSVYRDVFIEEGRPVSPTGRQENSPYLTPADQSQRSLTKTDQSQSSELSRPTRGPSAPSEPGRNTASRGPTRTHHKPPSVPPTELDISRPIGSLCAAGPVGVLTVRGDIEVISEEDIRGNREAEEGIRSIPRFQSYRPGEPSEVKRPLTPDRRYEATHVCKIHTCVCVCVWCVFQGCTSLTRGKF